MAKYLPWLMNQLVTMGVNSESIELNSLDDVRAVAQKYDAQLVVNCLGLGARRVWQDDCMYGVLGDLVYIQDQGFLEKNLNLAHLRDEDHPGGIDY
eukprot:TRINITY_DN74291_c0_g1_i1.p1 TRINITY_DN74291_c0_g1~~TRINITY_DN74291_c0_g1_i1.p1  ORF type:complete len:106 (-),score=14.13 TRINITY_DN74291_c0_g1_i1:9-296(-)